MLRLLVPAQIAADEHGWLTGRLLSAFTGSAEWVLWLLAALSILSIAVTLERVIFYASQRFRNSDEFMTRIAKGDFTAVRTELASARGMEAAVLREGLSWADRGVGSVEAVIDATIARERPRYERYLSFLGTLGANAPFIGLFGTVLGIIKAFHDLGATGAKGAQVQQTVMAGISEALVATAVGLAVAIPAVVAYNLLSRELRHVVARSGALGHELVGYLKAVSK